MSLCFIRLKLDIHKRFKTWPHWNRQGGDIFLICSLSDTINLEKKTPSTGWPHGKRFATIKQ